MKNHTQKLLPRASEMQSKKVTISVQIIELADY